MVNKILMFAPPRDRLASGGGIRAYYLSKGLSELGYEMTEIWGWKTKSLSPAQTNNKMKYLSFSKGKMKDKYFLVELPKSEKFINFLRKTEIPIILDHFDDDILQKEAYGIPSSKEALDIVKKKIEYSLQEADYIIFPSKTLMGYYPIEIQKKGIVIMNGSDPEHFQAEPLPKKPIIGVITGIASGRGIEMFLDSCIQLKKEFEDLEVQVGYLSKGGVPEYEKKIISKYQKPWICFRNDITYFDGAVDFYSSCYLTVVPNLKHFYMDASTPIKLFDTMASGRPVIVTNCIEQANIVQEEKCGLICDFTSEDMAEKISKLLKDKQLAEKMGQNGRKAMEEKHSWDIRAKKLVEFIN